MSIGVWQLQGIAIAPVGSDTPGQPNVLYESGAKILSGTVFKMWFGSLNGVCYAESTDGINWTRYSSNPVLVPSGSKSTGWTGYPKIFKHGSTYYAYVVNGNFLTMSSWTSPDGITWTQQVSNAVTPSQSWSNSGFFGQLVVAGQDAAGTWWGYYSGYNGIIYQVGRASSTDLLNWTAYAGNPAIGTIGGGFFQQVGNRLYYWCQNVQTGIPHFAYNGIPSDIARFHADAVTGPWVGPTAASTLYRINASQGIGSVLGQVADPCAISANGNLYLYTTVTPTGNGAPTNYQIACWTAPGMTFEQLIQTYEGVFDVPHPAASGFALDLNTLATDSFYPGDPNWTTLSVATGWGAPTFGTNIVHGTTSGVRGAAFYSALSWAANPDQWASVTLQASANASCYTSVMVRASTAGAATCYMATVGGSSTGLGGTAEHLFLYKFVANAQTTIYDSGGVLTFNVGDVLTLSVVGSTLSVYQNGNLLYTTTDASISSGAPGFSCDSDATLTNSAVSSFSCGNFSTTIGGNAGIAGATISDGSNSTTSDINGDYILSPEVGAKTITPSLSGYLFTPSNASETAAGAPITGVNFSTATGTPGPTTTYSIKGNAGSPGASVSLFRQS